MRWEEVCIRLCCRQIYLLITTSLLHYLNTYMYCYGDYILGAYFHQTENITTFIKCLVGVTEYNMLDGFAQPVKRKIPRIGRPSKWTRFALEGDHKRITGKTRRRCVRCSLNRTEKRTKIVCKTCQVGLCSDCFAAFHTGK